MGTCILFLLTGVFSPIINLDYSGAAFMTGWHSEHCSSLRSERKREREITSWSSLLLLHSSMLTRLLSPASPETSEPNATGDAYRQPTISINRWPNKHSTPPCPAVPITQFRAYWCDSWRNCIISLKNTQDALWQGTFYQSSFWSGLTLFFCINVKHL